MQALSSDPAVDVVLVTGGTGVTRRDVTPEAIEPLVTKLIPGFGELFRFLSYAEIGPATIQSRAFAALCGRALVFALPGSTGAVRLALERILLPQLDGRTRPVQLRRAAPAYALSECKVQHQTEESGAESLRGASSSA